MEIKMTLEELKELAQKLNFEHHHMLGAEKLEKQLREHCENTLQKSFKEVAQEYGYTIDTSYTPTPTDTIEDEEIKRLSKMTFDKLDKKTRKQDESDAYKHAMKLVRCIITCNNPNKSSYQGEIFSARNAKVPEVKKFISFGVKTHIPNILLNVIKEKQLQMFRKTKLANGNVITQPYLTSEYNIQLLDPITPEEFEAIKRKQLAEGKEDN